MTGREEILAVGDLTKRFAVRGAFGRIKHRLQAIDGVSFTVRRGETLGIVGESGSGKSTIGKCLIGIHRPDRGRVRFNGRDLVSLPRSERRKVARELQYVYQDPGASLDPRWKVGRLLEEPLVIHTDLRAEQREELVLGILDAVKLPRTFLDRYPHELSGGQQRRVGLARILTLNPALIVLDEPTSGLDVSVQAAVINLFREMKEAFDLTYIFISHDLSVVRILCDRVVVMYAGRIVELGAVEDLFERPQHPYTRTLLHAVPRIGGLRMADRDDEREPLLTDEKVATGCPFRPRCPRGQAVCEREVPRLTELSDGGYVACHDVTRE